MRVQQIKARGLSKTVTFFVPKKVANFTKPVFEALSEQFPLYKSVIKKPTPEGQKLAARRIQP